jgi:hypothetical protein
VAPQVVPHPACGFRKDAPVSIGIHESEKVANSKSYRLLNASTQTDSFEQIFFFIGATEK